MESKTIPKPLGQTERIFAKSPQDDVLKENTPFKLAFTPLLMTVIATNYRNLIVRFKRQIHWLVPLIIIWLVLWPVPMFTWYRMPSLFKNIGMFVIFLTATYNGFVGKAVFLTVVSRTLVPWFQKVKKGEGSNILLRLRRVLMLITKILKSKKEFALSLFVMSLGVGLAVSNLLTRNNKIDKYFVCLLLAIGILDDISKGRNNVVLQLFTALVRDSRKLIRSPITTTLRSGYMAAAGFSLGTILAFIPGQFVNSWTSYMGLYFGVVVFVLGIIVYVVLEKGEHKT